MKCANPNCDNLLPPNKKPGRARKWCSDKCRKTKYAGTCASCGGPTNGAASGVARTPKMCKSCRLAEDQRVWTHSTAITALRSYYARYGEMPGVAEWRGAPQDRRKCAQVDWAERDRRMAELGPMPSTTTIAKLFGGWRKAMEAAGLEGTHADRRATRWLWEMPKQYVAAAGNRATLEGSERSVPRCSSPTAD